MKLRINLIDDSLKPKPKRVTAIRWLRRHSSSLIYAAAAFLLLYFAVNGVTRIKDVEVPPYVDTTIFAPDISEDCVVVATFNAEGSVMPSGMLRAVIPCDIDSKAAFREAAETIARLQGGEVRILVAYDLSKENVDDQ